jgi:hypothetical protein
VTFSGARDEAIHRNNNRSEAGRAPRRQLAGRAARRRCAAAGTSGSFAASGLRVPSVGVPSVGVPSVKTDGSAPWAPPCGPAASAVHSRAGPAAAVTAAERLRAAELPAAELPAAVRAAAVRAGVRAGTGAAADASSRRGLLAALGGGPFMSKIQETIKNQIRNSTDDIGALPAGGCRSPSRPSWRSLKLEPKRARSR